MDALEFLKEKNRMMNTDPQFYSQLKYIPTNDLLVAYVEQWSKDNPKKTRLKDFLDNYPNTPLQSDGTPCFCPESIGMVKCDNCTMTHRDCWNQPLEV